MYIIIKLHADLTDNNIARPKGREKATNTNKSKTGYLFAKTRLYAQYRNGEISKEEFIQQKEKLEKGEKCRCIQDDTSYQRFSVICTQIKCIEDLNGDIVKRLVDKIVVFRQENIKFF